jgi:hypothetical protein
VARKVKIFAKEAERKLGVKPTTVPRNVTTNTMYSRMKRSHYDTITPIKIIRKMAKSAGKRHNVSITVSKDLKGVKDANAICYTDDYGKTRIRLHPLLKYSYKKNVASIIDHELDHAKVHKRIIRNQHKRGL